MSEKIVNTFTFYGNEEVKDFEQALIQRFQQDRTQGNDEMTAVKRIIFGLSQDEDFNSYEMMGADWAWYFGSTINFQIESKQCSVTELQDYITLNAAKIDPNVVVQMDFAGNTPILVGTRFTCLDDDGQVIASEAEQDLDFWFCDEQDVEETLENLDGNGQVMSYQELDQLIIDLRESALTDFNSFSGRDPITLISNS